MAVLTAPRVFYWCAALGRDRQSNLPDGPRNSLTRPTSCPGRTNADPHSGLLHLPAPPHLYCLPLFHPGCDLGWEPLFSELGLMQGQSTPFSVMFFTVQQPSRSFRTENVHCSSYSHCYCPRRKTPFQTFFLMYFYREGREG